MDNEKPVNNVMIYTPSTRRGFRCECGCNVFHKPAPRSEPDLFVCNGCGARWIGQFVSGGDGRERKGGSK